MKPPRAVWDGVLRRLGTELSSYALEVWLHPLRPQTDGGLHADDGGLRLLALENLPWRDRHKNYAAAAVAAAFFVACGFLLRAF